MFRRGGGGGATSASVERRRLPSSGHTATTGAWHRVASVGQGRHRSAKPAHHRFINERVACFLGLGCGQVSRSTFASSRESVDGCPNHDQYLDGRYCSLVIPSTYLYPKRKYLLNDIKKGEWQRTELRISQLSYVIFKIYCLPGGRYFKLN